LPVRLSYLPQLTSAFVLWGQELYCFACRTAVGTTALKIALFLDVRLYTIVDIPLNVSNCLSTQRNVSEDSNLYSHCCEKILHPVSFVMGLLGELPFQSEMRILKNFKNQDENKNFLY
jgi:hypothetical protein